MGSVNVVKTIKAPAKETVRKEDIARVTLKKAAYTMKARRSLWRPDLHGNKKIDLVADMRLLYIITNRAVQRKKAVVT